MVVLLTLVTFDMRRVCSTGLSGSLLVALVHRTPDLLTA
jgi:hypothetical protein